MLAAASEAPLRAIGLSKRYGRRTSALRNVDLEVASGAITGLVGPNGAGKSTLIRAWMGFEEPSEGRALVMGIDVRRSPDRARHQIGYVAQTPGFYDGLSVGDHVRMARLLRRDFDEAGALRRLQDLAIPSGQAARTLSGGQRAQVALSLAIATRAPVLLLDEPLANLDPLARREFLQQLRAELRSSATTVVLSSHVISDVSEACDRLVVLGGGKVLLNDAIDRLLADHRTVSKDEVTDRDSFVGSFVGPAGEALALHRSPSTTRGDFGRPASLEEVVLAHLSAGRERDVGGPVR